MNFGETLFKLRKEKNLSQEDVADKLNVTRQTVSKWETNQSTPDFDKIVPLCELFGISTEELLTGRKPEENNTQVENQEDEQEKVPTKEEVRKKSAEVVSTTIFIYILDIAIFMITISMNPVVALALFLCIAAWATARIVKHYMSIPKFEKSKEEKKETEIIKQINGIVGAICTVIYFIVSFATMAWHITWIIFIIDGLICQIIKLFFMLKDKEEKTDEE